MKMFKTFHDKQLLFIDVCMDLLEGINTPYSLSVALRLRLGKYGFRSVNPLDYLDSQSYLLDAQAYGLVSKTPYLNTGINLSGVAISKFFENETKCKNSNARITTIRNQENLVYNRMLSTARGFILNMIGDSPLPLEAFRFGPGATTSLRAHTACLINKVAHTPDVCSVALPQLLDLTRGTLYEQTITKRDFVSIVNHNCFTSVPKDARGNRGIAIEPDGNMVVQLSLGNQLRRRLRLAGYDLDYLSDHHRYFARVASSYGNFATIDLSSASDCICSELVKRLLPIDWWVALNRARSHSTVINGNSIPLEKFSSMGNGFTFELESLIFLSICHAASIEYGKPLRGTFHWNLMLPNSVGILENKRFTAKKEFYSVFGDDIICRTEHADLVISMLSFLGLDTNKAKTFTYGPFRESCGADFFNGIDVRPIFIKELNDGLMGLMQLYNQVCRISEKLFHVPHFFQRALKRILSHIPEKSRLYGPFSNMDNWLIEPDSSKYIFSRKMRKRQINLIRCHIFTPNLRAIREDSENLLLYALLGGESKGYTTRGQQLFSRVGYLHPL